MEYLNKQQIFGIQELYRPASEIEVDIVAVHGLQGDAIRTWTSDGTNVCWLNHPDLLPRYIEGARVLTWGYNANVASFKGRSTSSDRILQHAHTLVAELQADRELEGVSDRPIIFLCHSLGGIIVKRALAYSASQTAAKTAHMHSIYSCTFGILFFGTPHNGSSRAQLLGNLQKIVSLAVPKKILETDSSLLNALEEGSEVLQNITDQFASLMPRFHVFFFWEQQRTSLPYSNAYIVDETSAAPILDGTERSGIAADHRGICKFESRNSPGFPTVIAALRRYCREAPEMIKARSARANIMLSEQRWHEATELVKDLASHSGRATATAPRQDQSTRQVALPYGKSRSGIPGNLGFTSFTSEIHLVEDEKRSLYGPESFAEKVRRPFQEQRA